MSYLLLKAAYGQEWPNRFLNELTAGEILLLLPLYAAARVNQWRTGNTTNTEVDQ